MGAAVKIRGWFGGFRGQSEKKIEYRFQTFCISGFISGGVHHQLLQRPTTQHTITSYHQQKFGTTQMDLHQQHLFQQQSAVSYHNMNLQVAAAQPNLKPSQPEKKSKRSLPVLRKGLRLFNIMKPKERRHSVTKLSKKAIFFKKMPKIPPNDIFMRHF